MRGAPSTTLLLFMFMRIIPAYAGSTPKQALTDFTAMDHPRVCGEHFTFTKQTIRRWGSSPRMRGARNVKVICLAVRQRSSPRMRGARITSAAKIADSRIIPAYAGSTDCNWS